MDQPKKTVLGQMASKGLQGAKSLGISAFKNSRLGNKFKSTEDKERDVKNLLIKYIKQYIVNQQKINYDILTNFKADKEENNIVLDHNLELSVKKIENGVESYDSGEENEINNFLNMPLLSKEDPLTMKDLANTKAYASKSLHLSGTCRIENEIDRIVNAKISGDWTKDCSLPDTHPLKIRKYDNTENWITVKDYFEKLNEKFGRKSTKSSSSGKSILNLFVTNLEEKISAEQDTTKQQQMKVCLTTVDKVLKHEKYIPMTLMSVSQDFYYDTDIQKLIDNDRAWNACLEVVFGKPAAKVLSKKNKIPWKIDELSKSAISGQEGAKDFGFKSIIPKIVKENNQLFTEKESGSVPGIGEIFFRTELNLLAYQSQTHYKSLLENSFTTVNPVSTGPDTTSVPKVTNYEYPKNYYVSKADNSLQPYTSGKMFYAGYAAGAWGGDGTEETIVFYIPSHTDKDLQVVWSNGDAAIASDSSTSTKLMYRGRFSMSGGKRLTKKGGKKARKTTKKARKTAKKAKKSKKC